jgi:hypothetical protein
MQWFGELIKLGGLRLLRTIEKNNSKSYQEGSSFPLKEEKLLRDKGRLRLRPDTEKGGRTTLGETQINRSDSSV